MDSNWNVSDVTDVPEKTNTFKVILFRLLLGGIFQPLRQLSLVNATLDSLEKLTFKLKFARYEYRTNSYVFHNILN